METTTTKKTASPLAENYPLLLSAWEKHHPLIISEPGRHTFCAQCPEKKDCRLHLHLFFPGGEDTPNQGSGVSFKVPRNPAVSDIGSSAHTLLETAPHVADYLLLLLQEERQSRQELLLKQELYYLMDTMPEATILLDEDQNVVHCNTHALKHGLDSSLKFARNCQTMAARTETRHKSGLYFAYSLRSCRNGRKVILLEPQFIGHFAPYPFPFPSARARKA